MQLTCRPVPETGSCDVGGWGRGPGGLGAGRRAGAGRRRGARGGARKGCHRSTGGLTCAGAVPSKVAAPTPRRAASLPPARSQLLTVRKPRKNSGEIVRVTVLALGFIREPGSASGARRARGARGLRAPGVPGVLPRFCFHRQCPHRGKVGGSNWARVNAGPFPAFWSVGPRVPAFLGATGVAAYASTVLAVVAIAAPIFVQGGKLGPFPRCPRGPCGPLPTYCLLPSRPRGPANAHGNKVARSRRHTVLERSSSCSMFVPVMGHAGRSTSCWKETSNPSLNHSRRIPSRAGSSPGSSGTGTRPRRSSCWWSHPHREVILVVLTAVAGEDFAHFGVVKSEGMGV